MLIQTKYLGELDITDDHILTFPKGLLGFESHNEFVLISIPENDRFIFLQDIHNSYVSFLLITPWDYFKDYEINISNEELLKLGITPNSEDKPTIYNIVTIGKSFNESTTNLLAPIVINLKDKKGKQFVLHDSKYHTKHHLVQKELGE